MMDALADESYPYRLLEGDIYDAKGRRITVSGNLGIAQLLNTIVELRRDIRLARSATLPPSDGLEMVPAEPTPAMQQAGVKALRGDYYTGMDYNKVCAIWRAMLAAASTTKDKA